MSIICRIDPLATSGWPREGGYRFYDYIATGSSSTARLKVAPVLDIENVELRASYQVINFTNLFEPLISNSTSRSQNDLQFGIGYNFNGSKLFSNNGQQAPPVAVGTRPTAGGGAYNFILTSSNIKMGRGENYVVDYSFSSPPTITSSDLYTLSSYVRLYKLEHYEGGVLVHNYIPCKNPQGNSGVWDTVGETFYKCTTETNITVGTEFIPKI